MESCNLKHCQLDQPLLEDNSPHWLLCGSWFFSAIDCFFLGLKSVALKIMRLRYDSLLASLGLTTIIHAQRQSTRNLTSCLSAANVPVSLPSSQNYNQLSQPYNLRLHYTPAVIVLPKTTLHISNAVSCASRFGTKVQARSGGHSYASFSLGGRSSSMVIDLSSFQEITVIGGVAHVGAGVRLGNLALGIYNQSSPKALPHGVCPGVGIGGHSSHGGYCE